MNTASVLPVYSAAAIRQHEGAAAARQQITLRQLMGRAGHAAFAQLQAIQPTPGRLLVLSGKGNNGGDGYVLARLAADCGWQVTVAQVALGEKLTPDATWAQQAWRDSGGEILPVDVLLQATEAEQQHPAWCCDWVVDALLGTGLSGDVRDPYAALIAKVNQSGLPVLALDIPSGLCAESGRILGRAVQAAHTVSFVGLKPGLLTGQAAACVGQWHLATLGIEHSLQKQVSTHFAYCDYSALAPWLLPRARTSHKGHHGRVLLIGGGEIMPGALRLAGEACLRSGAGLVKLAAHPAHGAALVSGRYELMLCDIRNALGDDIAWADVCVLGPGLGRDAWGESCFAASIAKAQVVDADGLYWLANQTHLESLSRSDRILTPHAGEAARLLGINADEVENDRLAAAQSLVSKYGGVCVLKGPGTVIADATRCWIAESGNPGMASGGMGDVLSGIIAALLAQGLPAFDAAALGVCVHCQAAGRSAGKWHHERGLLAGDLMSHIRQLVNPSPGSKNLNRS